MTKQRGWKFNVSVFQCRRYNSELWCCLNPILLSPRVDAPLSLRSKSTDPAERHMPRAMTDIHVTCMCETYFSFLDTSAVSMNEWLICILSAREYSTYSFIVYFICKQKLHVYILRTLTHQNITSNKWLPTVHRSGTERRIVVKVCDAFRLFDSRT